MLVSRTMKTRKFKKAEKIFWRPASPRLSQGLDDRIPAPPPHSPLSEGLDDRTPPPPPHSPLSQGLDDGTPPSPPYLKVWIRHCIT